MISFTAVSFGYSGRPVLSCMDLHLAAGKVTVLVGPNGSGKSTVLRLCAGLLHPQSGTVQLGGKDLAGISRRELAKRAAFLPQASSPITLQARDAVLCARYPHRGRGLLYSTEDRAVAQRAMEQTACAHLADKPMNQLSGGERQRVLMAAVLAQQTDLLLLDEPTTYLDIRAGLHWMEFVRTLNREQSKTVVMVLHDLPLALRWADTVAVLHRGTVQACGPPEEILSSGVLGEVFGVEVNTFERRGRRYYCFG